MRCDNSHTSKRCKFVSVRAPNTSWTMLVSSSESANSKSTDMIQTIQQRYPKLVDLDVLFRMSPGILDLAAMTSIQRGFLRIQLAQLVEQNQEAERQAARIFWGCIQCHQNDGCPCLFIFKWWNLDERNSSATSLSTERLLSLPDPGLGR